MNRGVVGSLACLCLILTLSFPISGQAKSMYVRDWIVITLRSAPSETSQGVGTASTNDLVEVLEEGNGWVRIQTKDGKEGWVASRFLSAQPPRTLYVKQAEERLKALQAENMRLRGLIASRTTSGIKAPAVSGQVVAVPPEVTFADCGKLKQDYDRLVLSTKEYPKRISALEEENSSLKTSERLVSIFIGGVFIILGVVIGLFIQLSGARSKKHGYKF